MVKIEKEKYPSVRDFGTSNAKFYGYLYYNHKRKGTVWKYKDGRYCYNEDFDSKYHNCENRPAQIVSESLGSLKQLANNYYKYLEEMK